MDDGLETVVSGELTKFETPNTTVYGILKNYKVQKTPKGEGHVYEVETKNGIAAFFAPTLLQDKLKDIAIGRMVKITFLGMKKGNSGNEYKTFEVKKIFYIYQFRNAMIFLTLTVMVRELFHSQELLFPMTLIGGFRLMELQLGWMPVWSMAHLINRQRN